MTETRSAATATATTITTRKNKSGKGNLFILLLFTSILAHGILFSSRSIKPALVSRQIIEYGDNNNNNNNNVADVTDGTDVDSDSENNSVTQQEHQEQQQHSLRMRSTTTVVHDDNEQTQTQLPHWRLATDCSSYNLDCFTTARRENKYRSYPFPPSFKDIQEEEWSVETFDQIPVDWIEYLEKDSTMGNNNNHNNNNKSSAIEERNYLYPPTVSDVEYRTCFDLAVEQNKSTTEQLDELLSGEFPRIVPEPDTNMVAFTISDYSYVQDMIHDVFQMMEETVGFSNQHFFLVALDPRSVELACRYGYSVILWKADAGNLKNAVANTKVILSHELVKRGIDFFFTEMDVWWIRSPKTNLIEFQNRHTTNNNNTTNQEEEQKSDDEGKHIYFSGHQNNYNAPNIGVYAVKADEYSEEYFRVCLDVLKEKPDTHDQWVLAEVHRLFQHTYHNVTYNFGGTFEPDGPPETPTIQHPFIAKMFSPHEVVADERPMPTHQMLALHTLNNAPLQMPHGKKMIAKELAHQNRYHDKVVLRWTLAILIAIARKTNRIFVLPQIFDADMDAGTYFSWTYMDYSKVSDIVDFRETNFISNPKAWKSTGGSGSVGSDHEDRWPFESVVNTAFYQGDDGYDISIYTEVSNRSSVISKRAWKANLSEHDRLDAWIGSLSTVPELESAEVLLINPDFMMESGYLGGVVSRMKHYQAELEKRNEDSGSKNEETNNHDERRLPPVGRFELEILEIYDLLRWCLDDNRRHTVSKASASDSCYGIGDRKN
ncbi:hypothetical protein FRACYDRAFT_251163 [Fragilariopsis cylindrus CCMP1102]|uniref:Nucleotide-diphospho-sugar transferase domain-containing protein n=1 Tax=Fragilariopsis cylindrus CCMP1102 TaxID=635003 RepID=A0A1E7EN45_9STRA|nr:hypothetical protein FRACYDRAFT_251163 [Fragilariopsis cylindrus CCMP1102]|eukprot:OEU07358.1 hypothetical protein FRACYDRAFT_251163 [Fragilariopsis cylindrus CCMP1102]